MALYIVGTPLGNLGDWSPRAVETVKKCDFVIAEDTRVTGKLLRLFDISKPLLSHHEHNQNASAPGIWARLEAGEDAALCTDAGMPVISDPGESLVAGCGDRNIMVYVVPGGCALSAALSLSGLPGGRFCFEGFLSTAPRSRREHLDALRNERRTMIFYEAPHKLLRTLGDMLQYFGDRRCAICREMTKLHEETLRTTLEKALRHYEKTPPKGEFVLCIEGAPPPPPPATVDGLALAIAYLAEGNSLRDAARLASGDSGVPRRTLYEALLRREKED